MYILYVVDCILSQEYWYIVHCKSNMLHGIVLVRCTILNDIRLYYVIMHHITVLFDTIVYVSYYIKSCFTSLSRIML